MFNPAVDGTDLWSDEELTAELKAIEESNLDDIENPNDADLDSEYYEEEICDLAGMYDCFDIYEGY